MIETDKDLASHLEAVARNNRISELEAELKFLRELVAASQRRLKAGCHRADG